MLVKMARERVLTEGEIPGFDRELPEVMAPIREAGHVILSVWATVWSERGCCGL
jgi:hypothetical protein